MMQFILQNEVIQMKYKIVADSSANLMELEGVDFAYAPLKICTDEQEYVDDAQLDVAAMVQDIAAYKGKTSTACPNADEWREAFGDAEHVFCVAITSNLSGSYNAAMIAKNDYEAAHPDRHVCVIDTLSAGPEMTLVVEKIRDLIKAGEEYESICAKVREYMNHTRLIFSLESLKNLARNGRVKPAVAAIAGLIGIRLIGKASDEGTLEPTNKCRGERKALAQLLTNMIELGYEGGRVRIVHCMNSNAAQALKESIRNAFAKADIQVDITRGLCSYYAELGGLLVGFETR